jgi:hypothetical protein
MSQEEFLLRHYHHLFSLDIFALETCLESNNSKSLPEEVIADSPLNLAITTTLINVIANADPKDQAIATACTYLFRSLGSVVGVSWAATVVQQSLRTQLRAKLDSEGDADEIVKRVRQSLDFIRTLEPHTKLIVTKCYQKATNTTFGVSVGVISCGLLATFFIIEKRLSK